MNQRKAVANQLAQIRDTANRYLLQLTGTSTDGAGAARGLRRGRPPGSTTKGTAAPARGPKKRRPLSAEAREKIAAAQRARWAKQKSAKSGK
jgi:hypothetical protein